MATLKNIALVKTQAIDPQVRLNFDQIQEKVNQIIAHLGTTVAQSLTTAGSDTTALAAQIAAIQAELATIEAELAGLVPTYICATPVAAGQVVYESAAGYASVADNSATATSQAILGIAQTTGAIGAQITVTAPGQTATGFTGLTVGPVYLGPAGTLLSTGNTLVGYAVDAGSVLVSLGAASAPSIARTFMLMGG